MSKLEYKNGCVACNACGRLFEIPLPGDPPELVCPCGNSETLDALNLVTDTFNSPDAAPASDAGSPADRSNDDVRPADGSRR